MQKVIPDVAKLILPQKIFHEGSLKNRPIKNTEYPACGGPGSKENVTLTRLNVPFLKKAKILTLYLQKLQIKVDNPMRINFNS